MLYVISAVDELPDYRTEHGNIRGFTTTATTATTTTATASTATSSDQWAGKITISIVSMLNSQLFRQLFQHLFIVCFGLSKKKLEEKVKWSCALGFSDK